MTTGSDPLTRFVTLLAEHDPDAAEAVRRERRAGPSDEAELRLLHTALGELLAGREQRAVAAVERAEATEAAIRQRRTELAERGPVLAGQWPKRLHEALVEVRLAVTSAAAEAVRRLHDEARYEVEHGDREVRDGLPPRLALAVGRLTDGVLTRLDELLTELAVAVAAVAAQVPARIDRPVPPALLPTVPSVVGSSWERRAAGLLGLFGGCGLARLVWGYRGALPPTLAVLVPAIAVGVGVTLCGMVHRGRRASAQRALLLRWTAESLADLRGRLESEVARRVLVAERELGADLERAVAVQLGEADGLGVAAVDCIEGAELERLRTAYAELDRLCRCVGPRSV
jgi:hypothetical protein